MKATLGETESQKEKTRQSHKQREREKKLANHSLLAEKTRPMKAGSGTGVIQGSGYNGVWR